MLSRAPRPPAAVLILAAALAGMLAGLLALHQMISAERADALAVIDQRHAAAVQVAARELAAELAARAARARARIDAALATPLSPCADCYRRQGGRQLLPRLAPAATAGPRTLSSYHEELVAGIKDGLGGDDPDWARRARLHAGCRADRAAAARAAAAIVDDRSRYVLPVEQELASALALLDGCQLPPGHPWHAGLLRVGVHELGQRALEGVQPFFLRHLGELSAGDAAFARDRILAAAARAGVPAADFEARLAELAPAPLALPKRVDRPTLAPGPAGSLWYLEPSADGAEGLLVDLRPVLAAIAGRMRRSALLAPDDRIDVRAPATRAAPLDDLEVGVTMRADNAARSTIGRRYLVKLGLLVLCGSMALSIGFLGIGLHDRRRRILEIKAQFVAGVSHELRTPLASMRVLAETLLRRTQSLEQVRDYPVRLLRDIDGMSFLVENILSFNRLGRGRWQVRPETLKLRELATAVCEEAAERAGRSLRLLLTLEEGETMDADPELLRLLIRNLATNALGYNRRDPVEIRVQAARGSDRSLTVLFGDNGVGIAVSERERVFDDFYRGQGSGGVRGSGLGLALCRRVMALHRGTIVIEQSDPSGTLFRLWFPPPPSRPAS
jgi:two-component system sensor histidine kinase SenX3